MEHRGPPIPDRDLEFALAALQQQRVRLEKGLGIVRSKQLKALARMTEIMAPSQRVGAIHTHLQHLPHHPQHHLYVAQQQQLATNAAEFKQIDLERKRMATGEQAIQKKLDELEDSLELLRKQQENEDIRTQQERILVNIQQRTARIQTFIKEEEESQSQPKQWKNVLKPTTKSSAKSKDKDKECPICLIPDNERSIYWIDKRVCLTCGHAYHSECIHGWIVTKEQMQASITCPMCRAEIPVDDRVAVQQTLALITVQRSANEAQRSAVKQKKAQERMHQLRQERKKKQQEEAALRDKQATEHVAALGAEALRQAAAMELQQEQEKKDAKERIAIEKARRKMQEQERLTEKTKEAVTSSTPKVRNRGQENKKVAKAGSKKKGKKKKRTKQEKSTNENEVELHEEKKTWSYTNMAPLFVMEYILATGFNLISVVTKKQPWSYTNLAQLFVMVYILATFFDLISVVTMISIALIKYCDWAKSVNQLCGKTFAFFIFGGIVYTFVPQLSEETLPLDGATMILYACLFLDFNKNTNKNRSKNMPRLRKAQKTKMSRLRKTQNKIGLCDCISTVSLIMLFALHFAALSKYREQGVSQEYAFHIACKDGDINSISTLLYSAEYRDNIEKFNERENLQGQTPLLTAVQNDRLLVVKMLLILPGIEVNKGTELPDYHPLVKTVEMMDVPDSLTFLQGITPLYQACENNNLEMVEALLSFEPILMASVIERLQQINRRKLLKLNQRKKHWNQKVDINLRANNDQSPISIAAYYGHIDIVKRLLEEDNIDIVTPDDEGHTPESRAYENEYEEVGDLLYRYRVDLDDVRQEEELEDDVCFQLFDSDVDDDVDDYGDNYGDDGLTNIMLEILRNYKPAGKKQ